MAGTARDRLERAGRTKRRHAQIDAPAAVGRRLIGDVVGAVSGIERRFPNHLLAGRTLDEDLHKGVAVNERFAVGPANRAANDPPVGRCRGELVIDRLDGRGIYDAAGGDAEIGLQRFHRRNRTGAENAVRNFTDRKASAERLKRLLNAGHVGTLHAERKLALGNLQRHLPSLLLAQPVFIFGFRDAFRCAGARHRRPRPLLELVSLAISSAPPSLSFTEFQFMPMLARVKLGAGRFGRPARVHPRHNLTV